MKKIYETYLIKGNPEKEKIVISTLFTTRSGRYQDNYGKEFNSISQWRKTLINNIPGVKFRRIKE